MEVYGNENPNLKVVSLNCPSVCKSGIVMDSPNNGERD